MNCYACGGDRFDPFDDGLEVCATCCELVYPAEKVSRLRAFAIRLAARFGYDGTQDA